MKKLLTLLLLIAPWVADAQAAPEALSVSISDVRVVEGGAGPMTPAVFEVTLSGGTAGVAQVTVHWATQDLTAANGVDYQGDTGVLVFGALGTQTVTVNVLDDPATEATEVFYVHITSSAAATVTKSLGHAAVRDNDSTERLPNCDLDGDGHSNLMVFYYGHGHITDPEPHEPKHEDWGGGGTLASRGTQTVDYLEEADETWQLEAMNDFDGNGTCDLFWARDNEVTMTPTPPGGPMTAPHGPATLPSPGQDWRLVGSGHFNPDGAADLIWWHPPSRRLLAWVSSGGTYGTYSEHPLEVPAHVIAPLAVADIHGDGHKGILWRRIAGQLVFWRMEGLQFTESQVIDRGFGDVVHPTWRLAAVGDFNKDDTDDLIWQEPTGMRVAVWFMNGLGRVAESLLSPEQLVAEGEAGTVRGPR